MKPLVSPIASQIERFLQFKRAVGCRYRDEERQLGVLDRFLLPRLPSEDPVITDSIIRAYVKRSSHRLMILRQLCRFIALEEPRTVIPPPHFLGISRRPFPLASWASVADPLYPASSPVTKAGPFLRHASICPQDDARRYAGWCMARRWRFSI